MEDINKTIGKNLLLLRKQAKLTQLELAEKFNYSDKSISKWESGDSLPSIEVLYTLANFYNVTLNDLVSEEEVKPTEQKKVKEKKPKQFPAKPIITLLSVCAVWLAATILFVCFKLAFKTNYAMAFLWAVPASCIVLIVFNSIWGHFRYLFPILTVLLWSLITSIHVQLILIHINIWPIYFIGIPLQVAITLWGALVKRPKDYLKKQKAEKKKQQLNAQEIVENEESL